MKGPVIAIDELGVREIKIAEGVAISTPSVTHLVGLPHQGSPTVLRPFHTRPVPSKRSPHLSVWRGARKIVRFVQMSKKVTYSCEKSGQ